MIESMSFSGSFSSKNIPFKFLHSLEKKSSIDDIRFALSNKVSKVMVIFTRRMNHDFGSGEVARVFFLVGGIL